MGLLFFAASYQEHKDPRTQEQKKAVINSSLRTQELMNPSTQEGGKQIISQQARRWNFGQMD
jgi:hypothetical protein